MLYDRTNIPSFLPCSKDCLSQRKQALREPESPSFIKAYCEKEANDGGLAFSGTIYMNHQPKLLSRSFTTVTGCKSVDLRSLLTPP
jgi:hypothetical protein